MNNTVYFQYISSPIGKLLLTSDGEALTGLHMTGLERRTVGWPTLEVSSQRTPPAPPFVRGGREAGPSPHFPPLAKGGQGGVYSTQPLGALAGDLAPRPEAAWKQDDSVFVPVVQQLEAYFAGESARFDLPMRMEGTSFQRRVWQALCNIPFGHTISYIELARRVGNPRASRAVGGANGRNPIAVIVPCHRVIAAGGGLGGYGGGLDRKRWLLEHEASVLARHPEWNKIPSLSHAR